MNLPSKRSADVAIVGGGAAGLTAALFAAQTLGPGRVLVVDRAPRLGAKILISGGGRCNVTHETVSAADFNGSQPVIRNILASFGVPAVTKWFEELGVDLKSEVGGKIFPVSDQARTVLEALLRGCDSRGVAFLHGVTLEEIREVEANGFQLSSPTCEILARGLILATGGRSLPRTGSDGSGWELARRLGHSVTPTHPALVPLVLAPGFFHPRLSGAAIDVELSVYVGAKIIHRRRGPLLWTHFGISGPVCWMPAATGFPQVSWGKSPP